MSFATFLKTQSIFEGLSERDYDALAQSFQEREYGEGEEIIHEGDKGKELFLLTEGRVRVTRINNASGRQETINYIQAGEVFGILSLLDSLPAIASCYASGPVKVGVLQRNVYELLAKNSAPIALGFRTALARQLALVLLHQRKILTTIALEEADHHSA